MQQSTWILEILNLESGITTSGTMSFSTAIANDGTTDIYANDLDFDDFETETMEVIPEPVVSSLILAVGVGMLALKRLFPDFSH